jgi:hypothetical protein
LLLPGTETGLPDTVEGGTSQQPAGGEEGTTVFSSDGERIFSARGGEGRVDWPPVGEATWEEGDFSAGGREGGVDWQLSGEAKTAGEEERVDAPT